MISTKYLTWLADNMIQHLSWTRYTRTNGRTIIHQQLPFCSEFVKQCKSFCTKIQRTLSWSIATLAKEGPAPLFAVTLCFVASRIQPKMRSLTTVGSGSTTAVASHSPRKCGTSFTLKSLCGSKSGVSNACPLIKYISRICLKLRRTSGFSCKSMTQRLIIKFMKILQTRLSREWPVTTSSYLLKKKTF